jgi:2-hydroxyglutarate dehydrogenase
MYEYCEKRNLPCKRVGKLIVATRDYEIPTLHDLYKTAKANGVQGLEILDSKQIRDLEPNVQAIQALHSPNTGIVDYAAVGMSYADEFLASGRGQIRSEYVVPSFLHEI